MDLRSRLRIHLRPHGPRMCEYMGGLYLVSGPDRSSCLAPCNPAFLLRIKYWGVGCTSGCTSGCTYSLAHLTTFNRSETLPCMLPNSLLPPCPPACPAQVLRPPAPPCQELPQEEVRAHQPAAPQEEAQVNPRAVTTYRPLPGGRAGGRAGLGLLSALLSEGGQAGARHQPGIGTRPRCPHVLTHPRTMWSQMYSQT